MVELTGADTYFTLIDSTITRTQWEACIDQAIDLVNGAVGEEIVPNMSGTAGAKTVSLTSVQVGFIRAISVQVYIQDYKSAGATSSSVGIGGLSTSSSTSTSTSAAGGAAYELAQAAALRLREIEVSYG